MIMLSNGYINVTKICQEGNKKFNDWNRLNSSKELINELSTETGIPASGLMIINKGGNDK